MKKGRQPHAVKWSLQNFECGQCETGIVQIHQVVNTKGVGTATVSGCLDCGHEYGIRQASFLKEYTRDDMTYM